MTTITTSASDLLTRYAAGERDFHGANLSRAYLSRAYLSDADLSRAYLSGANLSRAYLSRAYLSDADLSDADLSGANLSGADLSRVKNPPKSSHGFLAEVLRQAAGEDVDKRGIAGLVLVSRDWCWDNFGLIAQEHWSPELRAWIAETLAPWPELVTLAKRYHVIARDAHDADGKGDEGEAHA